MSSASNQKLFCGIYSALKCSFDEFVRQKVVSPSYSSAILGPPQNIVIFEFVVLGKTLESALDCKEIKAINHNGNRSCTFFGRTDAEAEAETPVLWPLHAKS